MKRPWSQEKCDYYFEPVNKYNINGIYSALYGYCKESVNLGYIYNYFTMGSLLSALMIVFGVLIFVKIKK